MAAQWVLLGPAQRLIIPLCPLPLEQALLVVCALVLGLVIGVQVNKTMWKG